MLAISDPTRLHPGDVLIHPNRGGAVVDEVGIGKLWLELTDRLDRSEQLLPAADLADGWRLALPGGLFERSVLHPEEASAWVADHPTATAIRLAEELGSAVDRELATTWLVSRGLLAPGRAMGWWQEAVNGAEERVDVMVAGGRLVLSEPTMQDVPPDPARSLELVRKMSDRERFDLLERLGPARRRALLAQALAAGDAAVAARVLRWPDTLVPAVQADLDRLLSSGDRGLAVAIALAAPGLAAPALLADARANGGSALCGDVLAALPSRRRASLLMELLSLAVRDTDSIDIAEALIEDHCGISNLVERVDATLSDDPDHHLPAPGDGRWHDALRWLQHRGADTTMEMPSLLPTPLLKDSGHLAARDAFQVSISLARALARRHAKGLAGGVYGARLHRSEWRVDLGPPEPGDPADDVHDAMRLVLDLLIGRLAGGNEEEDDTLLAHLASLAPDVPPDWVAVAVRALDPDPSRRTSDGLALWRDLSIAEAVSRVRVRSNERTQSTPVVGFDTHIGAVKSRLGQTNQDALFFHRHGPMTLLLVADGISISSAGSGNLASALLVQAVATLWEEQADLLADADEARLHQFLRDALAAGNQAVCETALRLAGGDLMRHIPMGTTVVAALVRGGRAHISSLGDSRVYLVSPHGVAQLTGDGNLMGEWLRARQAGQSTAMEADGAALTSYVGHFDEDDAPDALPPQQRSITVLPGEHLLLCSDGLTDYAAHGAAEFARLVQRSLTGHESPGDTCRALVSAANAAGGGDNITVLISAFRD